MQPKVEQYRAHLTLPKSIHSITSNDYQGLQGQIRLLAKSENIVPTFDPETDDNTIFLTDQNNEPLGEIVRHRVWPQMSVTHLVNARKQGQKAA